MSKREVRCMRQLLVRGLLARSRSPYPRSRGPAGSSAAPPAAWQPASVHAGASGDRRRAGAAAGAVWRTCVCRVAVEGSSMMPTLAPGDRLLVVRLGRPRPGDLVALRDPDDPARLLVKRIKARGPAGVEVRGDNEAASRDSRAVRAGGPFPAARKSRLPLLPAGPGGPASTASFGQLYARSSWACIRRTSTGCSSQT